MNKEHERAAAGIPDGRAGTGYGLPRQESPTRKKNPIVALLGSALSIAVALCALLGALALAKFFFVYLVS